MSSCVCEEAQDTALHGPWQAALQNNVWLTYHSKWCSKGRSHEVFHFGRPCTRSRLRAGWHICIVHSHAKVKRALLDGLSMSFVHGSAIRPEEHQVGAFLKDSQLGAQLVVTVIKREVRALRGDAE